jgi:hypothetical protein
MRAVHVPEYDDKELELSVYTVLNKQGWRSMLDVSVERGVVHLRGSMWLRSDVDALVARVAAVNGVITIDTDRVHYDLDGGC